MRHPLRWSSSRRTTPSQKLTQQRFPPPERTGTKIRSSRPVAPMLLPYVFRRFPGPTSATSGRSRWRPPPSCATPACMSSGTTRTRATLDGLAIGTALLLLGWTLVLGSLWHHLDLTTAGGIVTLAYPFGDIVIIFFFVLKLRSTAATGRRPLFWVLLGLFAMAISDSTYAYLTEAGRYSTGTSSTSGGWLPTSRSPSERPTTAAERCWPLRTRRRPRCRSSRSSLPMCPSCWHWWSSHFRWSFTTTWTGSRGLQAWASRFS